MRHCRVRHRPGQVVPEAQVAAAIAYADTHVLPAIGELVMIKDATDFNTWRFVRLKEVNRDGDIVCALTVDGAITQSLTTAQAVEELKLLGGSDIQQQVDPTPGAGRPLTPNRRRTPSDPLVLCPKAASWGLSQPETAPVRRSVKRDGVATGTETSTSRRGSSTESGGLSLDLKPPHRLARPSIQPYQPMSRLGPKPIHSNGKGVPRAISVSPCRTETENLESGDLESSLRRAASVSPQPANCRRFTEPHAMVERGNAVRRGLGQYADAPPPQPQVLVESLSLDSRPSTSPSRQPQGQRSSRVHLQPRAIATLQVGAKRDLHRTISFEHSDASKKKIDEMTGSLQATKMVSRMWAPRLPQDAASCPVHIATNVINTVLDKNYQPPTGSPGWGHAFTLMSLDHFAAMCREVKELLQAESSCPDVAAPAKVFGDIHGQLVDLLLLFQLYGLPQHRTGDIHLINYIFLGDFVDRGPHSMEVVAMLFALKIVYPTRVTLIRGNHEDRKININSYGLLRECTRRCGASEGPEIWEQINLAFDFLPLGCRVEKRILCVHGGIGKHVASVEQIQAIQRPLFAPCDIDLVNDLLWSDPSKNDHECGVHRNDGRATSYVYGPDRVREFCMLNGLDLIIRAHQVLPCPWNLSA
ncbi:hypothetical protein CYMTET_50198, partial [Cymbomonas tetramitiformis]